MTNGVVRLLKVAPSASEAIEGRGGRMADGRMVSSLPLFVSSVNSVQWIGCRQIGRCGGPPSRVEESSVWKARRRLSHREFRGPIKIGVAIAKNRAGSGAARR
jgi:hypothetical protein